MMSETTVKKIRKGTRSCTECRQRKTRCIFTQPSDNVCQACRERNRQCIPQTYVHRRRSGQVSRDPPSNDRLYRLEQQIAIISARVGQSNKPVQSAADDETESSGDDDAHQDPDDAIELLANAATGILPGGAAPPTHMRLLFDNALIDLSDNTQRDTQIPQGIEGLANEVRSSSSRYLSQARKKLQRLIPSRSDVHTIATQGAGSLHFYTVFFPVMSVMNKPEAIHEEYDDYMHAAADPTGIAAFLLVLAMMIRQLPALSPGSILESVGSIPRFVNTVVRTVRTTVVAYNKIAPTLDGFETTIVYNHLLLARGEIRETLLSLRSLVALAELVSLPRVTSQLLQQQRLALADPTSSHSVTLDQRKKLSILESLCASDRMASMMFNLPAATSNFRLPPRSFLEPNGDINPQAFAFEVASVATRVQDIDEDFASGLTPAEIYDKVLAADRKLRVLIARTPKQWWNSFSDEAKWHFPTLIAQFFLYYVTVRVHLHFALNDSDDDEADAVGNDHAWSSTATYAYSRNTCIEACKNVARRHPSLRAQLPKGFFVARLMHMQVFTCATVLLLARYQNMRAMEKSESNAVQINEVQEMLDLALQMLVGLEGDANELGGEFARDAAVALRSLHSLLDDPTVAPTERLAIQIPMLGKVHIGRRPPRQAPVVPQATPMPISPSNLNTMQLDLAGGGISAPLPPMYAPAAPAPPPQQEDMSWLLELDLNSAMQNPFMTATGAELDGWMDWSADGLYPDMPS